jgi:hypothetical protein
MNSWHLDGVSLYQDLARFKVGIPGCMSATKGGLHAVGCLLYSLESTVESTNGDNQTDRT